MTEGVLDRLPDRLEDRIVGIGQTIVDPLPLPPRLDDSCSTQVRQMPGSLRLRDAQAFVHVADAHFAREEQAKDPQAGLVAERLKQPFDRRQGHVHIYGLTNISRPIYVNTYMTDSPVHDAVREKYAALARSVGTGTCGPTACGCGDPITSDLYSDLEKQNLPLEAVAASLGCGNPTALAQLEPGQTVLDLGSGGGIDVLLSARRVGPTGKAYGLDMTDEMLALARENQRKAGVTNVEFLKGTIERIPLPDASVDVIISNCVINLSSDKDAVLREAFRVLKPGGRLAVSDVVVRGEVPAAIRRSVELWVGCVAGALQDVEYQQKLSDSGFEAIEIDPWRVYRVEDARAFLAEAGLDADTIAPAVEDRFVSAFIRARKPERASCCGPSCCA
jgi:arsenite methyltransferase